MTKFESRDIHEAVAAGIVDAAAADRLLDYFSQRHTSGNDQADEEQFRLVTSFNDIFVTIGIALFLGALTYLIPLLIGQEQRVSFFFTMQRFIVTAAPVIAATSWILAEIFTRIRRMALPSIVLLGVFVSNVGLVVFSIAEIAWPNADAIPTIFGFTGAALAAVAHWKRFQVPITVATGTAAVAGLLLSAISYNVPALLTDYPYTTVLPLGLITLGFAFWFDMQDRLRMTRRTDIAFWLHLLAAPMIVHPIIYPLMTDSGLAPASAAAVIVLFVAVGVVALIIDRRALLVSSLAYFGYAAYEMIRLAGLEAQGTAIATLVVGATVLFLSIGWQLLRKQLVTRLPGGVQSRVPPTSS